MGGERTRRVGSGIALVLLAIGAVAVAAESSAPPAAAAVPAPGPDEAVVTVRVGGDRIDDTTIGTAVGTTLGLYATQTGTTPLATCVSDADGDCSFVVSGPVLGTAPWVGQVSAPAGWNANDRLRTGPGSGSGSIDTPYRFATPVLAAGQTYRSTSEFMYSSSNSLNTRSNGVWQQSRANPALPASCGMDVALVLDLSASVGSNLPTLKSAADSFADAFVGTPSRMAVYSFSAQSPSVEQAGGAVDENRPALQSVSTQAGADAFKAQYAGWGLGAGTNWDAALQRVAASGVHYDAVIVLTDGNPTRWGADTLHGDGSNTHFTDVEAAVFSANTLKAQGTRVVSFGVGNGVSGITALNLAAISGPEAFDAASGNVATADYFQIPEFSGAGDELRRLAVANCSGSLTVVKQIVPSGTTGEDVTGAVPAGPGWTFTALPSTPGAAVTPGQATTAGDGTGGVAFEVSYPAGGTTAELGVVEAQQLGYTLVTQAGANAVCRDLTTGSPATAVNLGPLGFSLAVPIDDAVSCVVYNRAPPDPATVRLDKTWIVDGATYPDGAQPAGLTAQASLTPPGGGAPTAVPFGTDLTGYSVGATVTIDESTTITAPGCTLVSSRVTGTNGTATDAALPFAPVLTTPASRYDLTNVVTCTAPAVTPPPPTGSATARLADSGSADGGPAAGALALAFAVTAAGAALLAYAARRRVG